MKVVSEINLNEFKFWAGAADSRKRFSYDEMEQLNDMLEEFEEEWEDVQLNDLFWFEPETLCEWLGIDFDEWVERDDEYFLNN